MHIGFFVVFTAYLSNAVISGKSPFSFSGSRSSEDVCIAHGPPCARIAADRQTDTHRPCKYYNPHCACAPRVN